MYPPTTDPSELGIRVPMLVISPYAKARYVDDACAEFSAPLPHVAATNDLWDWPEDFAGWPEGLQPEGPRIRYP